MARALDHVKAIFSKSRVAWSAFTVIVGVPAAVAYWQRLYSYVTGILASYAPSITQNNAVEYTLAAYTLYNVLATILIILTFSAYRRHRVNSIALDKYRKCAPEFLTLWTENAQTDKRIFDILHKDIFIDKADLDKSKEIALREISSAITTLLDSLCVLMRDMTGKRCAACVKLMTWPDAEKLDLNNVTVETFLRDRMSRGIRSKRENTYGLNDNSANSTIIPSNGEEYYLSNDLRDRHYRTQSKDFLKYYDATVVVGIPELMSGTNQVKIQGLLCVDNFGGNFDEAVCPGYMEEIAWRIATLLHRQNTLRLDYHMEHKQGESGQ